MTNKDDQYFERAKKNMEKMGYKDGKHPHAHLTSSTGIVVICSAFLGIFLLLSLFA